MSWDDILGAAILLGCPAALLWGYPYLYEFLK